MQFNKYHGICGKNAGIGTPADWPSAVIDWINLRAFKIVLMMCNLRLLLDALAYFEILYKLI